MSDLTAYDLMIAGYGCPSYNTTSGGYFLAHDPITTAWFFDDSQVVALPAELGSSANLSTVTIFNVLVGASVASARVGTYRKSGNTYTQIGVSAATGTWATNAPIVLTLTTPLAVQTGDRIAVEITLAAPGEVSIGKVKDAAVTGNVAYSKSDAMLASFVVGDMEHTLADCPIAMRAYVSTSHKRAVVDTSSVTGDGTARIFTLGSFRTAPYWIIIEGAQVNDGKAIQFDFKNLQTQTTGGNNLKLVTSQSLILDMAATNQITWCGANVALDASEVGDVFDFYIWVDPVNRLSKLFFVNKTTGQSGDTAYPTVRCHPVAVAEAATPGTGRDATNFTYPGDDSDSYRVQHWQKVAITATADSTAVVGSMGIARKPWFLWGASFCGQTSAPWGRNRIGTHLHSTSAGFQYLPWMINTGVGGDRMTRNTAGFSWWKRFGMATINDEFLNNAGSASTIGLHDLCEIRDAVVCIIGYGINDVLAISDAAIERLFSTRIAKIMGSIIGHLAGGADAAVSRNCEIVVTSSVPAASNVDDSLGGATPGWYTRGTTVRHNLDSIMPGLCRSAGAIFVPITKLLGGRGEASEIFDTAVEDANSKGHPSDAMALILAKVIAKVYENGDVPAEVTWPQGVDRTM